MFFWKWFIHFSLTFDAAENCLLTFCSHFKEKRSPIPKSKITQNCKELRISHCNEVHELFRTHVKSQALLQINESTIVSFTQDNYTEKKST